MPIGSSLIGRASDSESGGYRFESCLPRIILLVDIDAGMVELVDTLGLEPSALRCAGSSPVPGNYYWEMIVTKRGFYVLIKKIFIKSKKSLENGSKFCIVFSLIRGSSAVEQLAVNQLVVGSNPTLGVFVLYI